MKRLMVTLGGFRRPLLRAARRIERDCENRRKRQGDLRRLQLHARRREATRLRHQREAAREVRRCPGQSGAQVRRAPRDGARREQLAAKRVVDVRRARHGRHQRVCRAGRIRAHHARRAGAHPERGGARRGARTRNQPRDVEAHDHSDSEDRSCWAQPLQQPGRPSFRKRRTAATRSCSRTTSIAATRWPPTSPASSSRARPATRRSGLGAFLTRLAERNKDLKDRSGIFASHPETDARLTGLKKVISDEQLATTATVAARYTASITFKPVPVGQVAQVAPPTAGGSAPAPSRNPAAPASSASAA